MPDGGRALHVVAPAGGDIEAGATRSTNLQPLPRRARRRRRGEMLAGREVYRHDDRESEPRRTVLPIPLSNHALPAEAAVQQQRTEARMHDTHRPRRVHHLEDLGRDLRYAARTLRSAPTFAIVAVATLALGIGANTAIFGAVNGVLLQPLPFSKPDRIVRLFQNDRKKHLEHDDVAPANFADWRARTTAFAGVAAAEPFGAVYSGAEGDEELRTWNVTSDFFTVLDARPVIGRLFQPQDFARGAAPVVVLTYASWQTRFGGDRAIVGRRITLDHAPVTVVGVLPRDFTYLATRTMQELYAPTVLDSMELHLRSSAWYNAVARLAPGVTIEQARADLARVSTQLAREYPTAGGRVRAACRAGRRSRSHRATGAR
jgi:hypothetical protein